MTKLKTTRKHLMQYYGSGYTVDMPHLLDLVDIEPFAYTCGTYGWNFDAYDVDGILLTSGYRNTIGPRLKIAEKYEEKARKINKSLDDWIVKKKKVKKVWRAFVRELKGL